MEAQQKQRVNNKYRAITLSVIVFLLLLATLLAGNFYLANKQARDILRIDIIGETSDANYDVLVAVQQLHSQQLTQQPLAALEDLKEAQQRVETYLNVLRKGGQYDEAGGEALIEPLEDPDLLAKMDKLDNLWQEYRQHLARAGEAGADLAPLAEYATETQSAMYDGLDEILVVLTEASRAQSNHIAWLQILGVLLMVAYFILFVFYFVRQMKHSDNILEEARQETRDILDSVSEGFFLLDRNMKIGQEHSRVLGDILQEQHIGGRSFLDLVSGILVSERKQDALKLFVDQLYNAHVVEKLIQSLNPLRRIDIGDGHDKPARTLSFKFSRVLKDKQIEKVLVSVRDMTEEARLEERLKQEQEQTNQQAEMISQLMNANYAMMATFLKRTRENLYAINTVLKEPGTETGQLKNKAQSIAREIHSIKGEASALKLGILVSKAEQFEDKVKALLAKSTLVGNDFLSAVVDLEAMLHVITQAQEWHGKMRPATRDAAAADHNSASSAQSKEQALYNLLADFVRDIAKRQGKEAVLDARGLDYFERHPAQWDKWKDTLIQLLRNAVSHGLETPVERSALMKPRQGTVKLTVEQTPAGHMRFVVEDDGQGIDFQKIRHRAVQQGMASADDIASWDNARLLNLIFKPGFSTQEAADEDAGRGVGMDIVKERVQQQRAQLKIRTANKQFTRFVIDL